MVVVTVVVGPAVVVVASVAGAGAGAGSPSASPAAGAGPGCTSIGSAAIVVVDVMPMNGIPPGMPPPQGLHEQAGAQGVAHAGHPVVVLVVVRAPAGDGAATG